MILPSELWDDIFKYEGLSIPTEDDKYNKRRVICEIKLFIGYNIFSSLEKFSNTYFTILYNNYLL